MTEVLPYVTYEEALAAAKFGGRVRYADWNDESYMEIVAEGLCIVTGNSISVIDKDFNVTDMPKDAKWQILRQGTFVGAFGYNPEDPPVYVQLKENGTPIVDYIQAARDNYPFFLISGGKIQHTTKTVEEMNAYLVEHEDDFDEPIAVLFAVPGTGNVGHPLLIVHDYGDGMRYVGIALTVSDVNVIACNCGDDHD